MPSKKNTPVESQPKAVKLNKEVDLDTVGKHTQVVMKDAVKVKKIETNNGQTRTVFDFEGQTGERAVPITVLQPFLSMEEVEKIGIAKWHTYKGNPNIFTTVINGRRFKLDKEVFERCKDKGLVLQDG